MKFSSIRFKTGSYITVENKDEGDHFYIIRRGRVKIFSSLNYGKDLNRLLGPGDFFEVISSMMGQPRLSSSRAIEDTHLIAVRKNQFGFLIQNSTPLALKIIRSFSDQLRKFNNTLVEKTLDTHESDNNPDQLFYQGEFYKNKNQNKIATYIFIQYIKNFAYSELALNAAKHLANMGFKKNSPGKIFPSGSSITRRYKKGDILFSEFEPGYEMFIIEKGQINISKVINNREVLIAVLKKGDLFGEMALLNNETRSASAIASEDTTCMVINIRNFNSIIKRNVILAVRIITLLSERIWTIYKQLDNFYFTDTKSRIYHTLITQVQKNQVKTNLSKPYTFNFGPAEIKHMLGIDELEVARAIDEILDSRLIQLNGNKFYCTKLLDLEKEVDFARKMEQRQRKIEGARNT